MRGRLDANSKNTHAVTISALDLETSVATMTPRGKFANPILAFSIKPLDRIHISERFACRCLFLLTMILANIAIPNTQLNGQNSITLRVGVGVGEGIGVALGKGTGETVGIGVLGLVPV